MAGDGALYVALFVPTVVVSDAHVAEFPEYHW
jgi:hypothetical protein